MADDRFASFGDDADNPGRSAFAIVPHDTNELPILPKALLIGVSGDIVLRAVDSPADVTIAAFAGQLLPIRAAFVRDTGTTADNIVGLA